MQAQCGRHLAYNLGGSFSEMSEGDLDERLLLYRTLLPPNVSKVYFEPGRALVGDAGCVMCRICSVDDRTRELTLDSCAYIYRLTSAMPRAELIGDLDGRKSLWTVRGVWPSESDILTNVELSGEPHAGDLLLLKNLGAYTRGLEHQFDPEGRFRWIIC
jgi:diaminopimelate decarboxylase